MFDCFLTLDVFSVPGITLHFNIHPVVFHVEISIQNFSTMQYCASFYYNKLITYYVYALLCDELLHTLELKRQFHTVDSTDSTQYPKYLVSQASLLSNHDL